LEETIAKASSISKTYSFLEYELLFFVKKSEKKEKKEAKNLILKIT